MAEDVLATLERWCASGADYRVTHVSESLAVVQLLTCYGEPVERLREEAAAEDAG